MILTEIFVNQETINVCEHTVNDGTMWPEENSSNSSSLVARRKKTGFKDDDIDKVGVQPPPPTTVLKSAGRTTPKDATHRRQ